MVLCIFIQFIKKIGKIFSENEKKDNGSHEPLPPYFNLNLNYEKSNFSFANMVIKFYKTKFFYVFFQKKFFLHKKCIKKVWTRVKKL